MEKGILFLFILSIMSCAPKVLIQDAYLLESEVVDPPQNRVDIKMFYGGDAIDFVGFQLDIDNKSNDTIYLNESDVTLLLGDILDSRRHQYYPIPKRDILRTLVQDADNLEREKKTSTAAGLILSGLDVIGAVVSGAGTAETVIYGTGTAVDLMEERRWYNETQMTVEEQIAYHEEYTLENAVILPGRSASYDVYFDRLLIDGYCSVVIECHGHVYQSDFELEVKEIKLR